MGILHKNNLSEDSLLGVWKITETFNDLFSQVNLNSDETTILNNFSNNKRKIEWLCTRLLLKELTNSDLKIIYNEEGKPYLDNNFYNISISHSKSLVSIILSKNSKVGIDIEEISDKIERVINKFLSKTEQNTIVKDNLRLFHLYLCWSAKEALYKVFSEDKLNFIENISIMSFQPKNSGIFYAKVIINELADTYALSYELIDNNVLVWCKI